MITYLLPVLLIFATPMERNNQNHLQRVSAATFAAKYKSKKEIFNMLSVQAGAYLCAYECLTIYFLKDLISGKKKCKFTKPCCSDQLLLVLKCGDVSYLFCP